MSGRSDAWRRPDRPPSNPPLVAAFFHFLSFCFLEVSNDLFGIKFFLLLFIELDWGQFVGLGNWSDSGPTCGKSFSLEIQAEYERKELHSRQGNVGYWIPCQRIRWIAAKAQRASERRWANTIPRPSSFCCATRNGDLLSNVYSKMAFRSQRGATWGQAPDIYRQANSRMDNSTNGNKRKWCGRAKEISRYQSNRKSILSVWYRLVYDELTYWATYCL